MARGQRTPPEVVYQIMASWAATKSYKGTAEALGLAVSTVKKIVDEHKDDEEFVKLCNEKGQEFSEKASRIIMKAMDRLEREIDDEEKDIPVNQLTTAIGTLIDKKALVDGTATEHVSVEVRLPPGVDEYAG